MSGYSQPFFNNNIKNTSINKYCKDGRNGIDGKDGKPGKDGLQGPKGTQGRSGINGEKGIKGEPGISAIFTDSISDNIIPNIDGSLKGGYSLGNSDFAFSNIWTKEANLLGGNLNIGNLRLFTKIVDGYESLILPENVLLGESQILGATGPQGLKGDTGLEGNKGEKGDNGIRGPPGPQGASGSSGIRGSLGPIGLKGNHGNKGDIGEKGDQGESGAAAFKGDKGANGNKGELGLTGIKGDMGYTGNKGDTGEKGSKGDEGLIGPTGTTKTSELTNDANFATVSDIPTKISDLEDDSNFLTDASIEPKIREIIDDSTPLINKTFSSDKTEKTYISNYRRYVPNLALLVQSLKHAKNRTELINITSNSEYGKQSITFDGILHEGDQNSGLISDGAGRSTWDNKALIFNIGVTPYAVNEFTIWLRDTLVPESIINPLYAQNDSFLDIVLKIYGHKDFNPEIDHVGWKDLNLHSSLENCTYWMEDAISCKSYYRKIFNNNNLRSDVIQGWTFRATSNIDNYMCFKLQPIGGFGLVSKEVFDITLDYKKMYELDYTIPT